MRSQRSWTPRSAVGFGVLLLACAFPHGLQAYDFSNWHHGAPGHDRAIQEAMGAEKPVVVYFHATWCKWSKAMNEDYLASSQLDRFLDDFPKVEIEPDKGAAEKSLSKQYGVTGFPSFLVFVPAIESKPGNPLHSFKKGQSESVDEFFRAVQAKIAYNQKAHGCYRDRSYKEAIAYYETSLEFDPENANTHYGLGTVYHAMAHQQKEVDLLREAEACHQKALDIDPDHKAAKAELEKLRKAMKQMEAR